MCNVVENWLEVLALGRLNSFFGTEQFYTEWGKKGQESTEFQALTWFFFFVLFLEVLKLSKRENFEDFDQE